MFTSSKELEFTFFQFCSQNFLASHIPHSPVILAFNLHRNHDGERIWNGWKLQQCCWCTNVNSNAAPFISTFMGAWCKFVAFHIFVQHPLPSIIRAAIGMKWLTYISLQHIWHIPLHPSLMCFGNGGWAGPTHIPFQHTLQLHLTCGNFYLNSLMCLMWVEMWRKFEHMDKSIPSSTTYSISILYVATFTVG